MAKRTPEEVTRRQLLEAARRLTGADDVTVLVVRGAAEVVTAGAARERAEAAGLPPHGEFLLRTYLDPVAAQVVAHLAPGGPQRGDEIAAALKLGRQAPPGLRAVLASLVSRGVLAHGRRGYAVPPELRPLLPLLRPESDRPTESSD
jgi:hypothetical protein